MELNRLLNRLINRFFVALDEGKLKWLRSPIIIESKTEGKNWQTIQQICNEKGYKCNRVLTHFLDEGDFHHMGVVADVFVQENCIYNFEINKLTTFEVINMMTRIITDGPKDGSAFIITCYDDTASRLDGALAMRCIICNE